MFRHLVLSWFFNSLTFCDNSFYLKTIFFKIISNHKFLCEVTYLKQHVKYIQDFLSQFFSIDIKIIKLFTAITQQSLKTYPKKNLA